MPQTLKKVITVIVLAVIGLTLSVTEASAQAPSRATLAAAASRVEYEVVGGGNYSKYKKLYPTTLNWGNDGCSVPTEILSYPGIGTVLKYYSGIFKQSCDRHDFGYRNFGKNTSTAGVHLKLNPTQARKNSIDNKFAANMKIQCDKAFSKWYQAPARVACYSAAGVFYSAVVVKGHKAFFG